MNPRNAREFLELTMDWNGGDQIALEMLMLPFLFLFFFFLLALLHLILSIVLGFFLILAW